MKVQYITGCTYNDLTINGVDADNIHILDLQDICKQLIDKTTDKDTLQQIIIDYVCQLDRSELSNYDSYHCETCGDYVETYELEV